MFFPAEDLASLYADCADGNAVHTPAVGGASTTGSVTFHAPGSTVLGGQVMVTDYGITFAAGVFPAVKRGDVFVFAGTTYHAREAPESLYAGGELFVPLTKG